MHGEKAGFPLSSELDAVHKVHPAELHPEDFRAELNSPVTMGELDAERKGAEAPGNVEPVEMPTSEMR